MEPDNINRRKEHDRIATEAADWWSSLELGTANRDAFRRWREADPAHAIAFARVQASWEVLVEQGDAPLIASAATPVTPPLSRRRFLRNAAAGVALFGAGTGGLIFTSRAMAWSNARTSVGEFRRIRLPDASLLELNTDTSVAWRLGEHARDFRLERGEIAIELSTGAPATLGGAVPDVQLSPGRFNARVLGDHIGLTVLQGRAIASVHTASARKPAPIQAGEVAELSQSQAKVQATTAADRVQLTAWQSGDIVLDDQSLQTAVDEYNRYLTRKIFVQDVALANMRVGGRFTTSDPSAFLRAVALALDVRVQQSDEKILILKK